MSIQREFPVRGGGEISHEAYEGPLMEMQDIYAKEKIEAEERSESSRTAMS